MAAADRARWLQERHKGIGSSDAPAVIGISRWTSPLALYYEKTGEAPPEEKDAPWLDWGTHLEPVACDWYAEVSGRRVERWDQTVSIAHPERPWMRCTPDARQWDPVRGEGLLEVKCPLQWTAEEWEDGTPLTYQVQLQHQLDVIGLSWGTVVAVLPGERPQWQDFDRHAEFLRVLVEREAEFWRAVETRTPPNVDGAEATAKAIARRYRVDNGETVILPDEAAAWDARLVEVKAALKGLEAEKAELENRLKTELGEATYGVIPGVPGRYRWQVQHKKAYTVKASSSRVLLKLKR